MVVHIVRRLVLAASLIAVVSFSAACAGSSEYMREVPATAPIAPVTDQATVVFIRPSGLGFAINFSILDQMGRWVGDAVAKSHFAVQLPPGEYMFVGWAENTAALKAKVAAGRVYYVEVAPSMGFGSAHVTLEALSPRHPDWSALPAWLKDTHRLEPLPSGASYIEGRRQDSLERVKSAMENWQEYSPEEKAQRTLYEGDGT